MDGTANKQGKRVWIAENGIQNWNKHQYDTSNKAKRDSNRQHIVVQSSLYSFTKASFLTNFNTVQVYYLCKKALLSWIIYTVYRKPGVGTFLTLSCKPFCKMWATGENTRIQATVDFVHLQKALLWWPTVSWQSIRREAALQISGVKAMKGLIW